MVALAAVLCVIAWGMSEAKHFLHIFRISRADGVIMLLTFLLTIFLDLTIAIGVGVTLSCLLFMKRMSESVEIKSEWRKLSSLYGEVDEHEAQRDDLPKGVEVFKITGPFFFGVASDLINALTVMGQTPVVLILRMRLVPYIDASGENALKAIVKQCPRSGTQIILSGLQPQPLKILKSTGDKKTLDHILLMPDYESALMRAKNIVAGEK